MHGPQAEAAGIGHRPDQGGVEAPSVVDHIDEQLSGLVGQRDHDPGGRRVLPHVGQRALHQPQDGHIDLGGGQAWVTDHLQVGAQAGLGRQPVQQPPNGGRQWCVLELGGRQRMDDASGLDEVLRGGGLDLAEQVGLDVLEASIVALPQDDRWSTLARAALREDVHAVHGELTAAVLRAGNEPAEQLVSQWLALVPGAREKIVTLRQVCEEPDVARMSVGVRLVRSLLPA